MDWIQKDNMLSQIMPRLISSLLLTEYDPALPIRQSYLETPKLVLENITDNNVYSAIVKWNLICNNVQSDLTVKYDPIHGGGATTPAVCSRYLKDGFLTFALCDSDKKSPFCKYGDTAKDTKKVFKEHLIPHQFYIIDVHEVENLLPIDVLFNTAREEQLPALEFVRETSLIEPSSYSFYDFKEAITYNYVHNNMDSGNYWKNILSQIPSFDMTKRGNSIVTNRLSSMLPHAITSLNTLNFSEQEIEPQIVASNWSEIAGKLMSWCITRKPISIS